MKQALNVLLIEDSEDDTLLLIRNLKKGGFEVNYTRTDNEKDMLEKIDTGGWDIIITDYSLPNFGGMRALELLKEKKYNRPCIMVSGNMGEEAAVDAMIAGASDYILKENLSRLVPAVKRELAEFNIRQSRKKTKAKLKNTLKKLQKKLNQEKIIKKFLSEINKISEFPYHKLNQVLEILKISLKAFSIQVYRHENGKLFNVSSSEINKNLTVADEVNLMNMGDQDGVTHFISSSLVLTDFTTVPQEMSSKMKDLSINAVVSIPVILEEKHYGLIFFIYQSKDFLQDFSIRFLETIADGVSILLKRHFDFLTYQNQQRIMSKAQQLSIIGSFSSAIAHEINQPLQSIKILADSILFLEKENKHPSSEIMLQNFRKISERTNRIDETIKNMRLLLQSPEKIEMKPIYINQLIQDVLDMYYQKIVQLDIKIMVDFDYTIKTILFSDIQFQQVISNLIDNSLKALMTVERDEKILKLRTFKQKDSVMLEIADNGPGISDETKQKIFDPFYTTFPKGSSMGLGLYVVTHILKQFQANIQVKDNEWHGATFQLEFKY